MAFLKLFFSGERLLAEAAVSQERVRLQWPARSSCLDQSYREFESLALRHLVSVVAGSPDISLKTPEFLGFSAPVGRRRPSPRGR
jgi:hypothetical protein